MQLSKYHKIAAAVLFGAASMNTHVLGADEQKSLDSFKGCPESIKFSILEHVVFDNAGDLKLVCKDWQRIIEQDQMKKSIERQVFLKLVLVYKPQEGSDIGRIDMPIARLKNPQEDTFDLSVCGDASKHLSISTGRRKEKKAENAGKVEIWITSPFIIKQDLATAGHLKEVEDKGAANAVMWIFWNWGGFTTMSRYDYSSQNTKNLSTNNLYEKWQRTQTRMLQYNPMSEENAADSCWCEPCAKFYLELPS